MPIVHAEPFRARYYECDAYGHLASVTYLRWMQEAAFAASASAGYDLRRYKELGHVWLVRDTQLNFSAPVRYEDAIILRTWVADFRRSHSRRRYEFVRAVTGDIVAQAVTDWVYINSQSLHPATVPPAMQQTFCPEGSLDHPAARDRFPMPPPAPPQVFTVRTRVEWPAIDTMWHVNNAMYLSYVEEAGLRLWEALGWPVTRRAAAGLALAARQYRIEYRLPAQLGDELEISTWLSDPRPASVRQHYALYRAADHALLARASTRWVWVETETRRPRRVPPEARAALSPHLSPAPG